MKLSLKTTIHLFILFSFLTITLHAIYSKEALFLVNNQDNIKEKTDIITTLGPIEITKFKGKIVSKQGNITSADEITLAGKLASLSSKKGKISCKNNIGLNKDSCTLSAESSIATSTGSITIDASDCVLKAINGAITAKKDINITTNGTGSLIKASGDIVCDLTVSASATNSIIGTTGGNITSRGGITPGSGLKVIAWGAGSSITAKKTIFADHVEAKTIVCKNLVTHNKNRLKNGSIRTTRTNAGGTITADTIIAHTISGSYTAEKTETISDAQILASIPLNLLF